MTRNSTPSRLLALLVLAALGACGPRQDPRFADLTVGITRDSVVTVMGGAEPGRTDPYLVNGTFIEALLFDWREQPAPGDTVADRRRSPVVLLNGSVGGWGWAYWDSVSTANGIPLSPQN